MFTAIETWLINFATTAPLPLVSFVVSLIEEVIPPIPASATIVTIGSLASVQGYALSGLIVLTLAASLGKTIGSIFVYVVADRTEDIFTEKVGKYFGVTSASLEKISKRLGNGIRDYVALIVLRSLPIIPSSLVSISCGLLRLPWPLYLTATFVGTTIRYGFFFFMGFVGAAQLTAFVQRADVFNRGLELLFVAALAVLFIYLYTKRQKK